MNDGWYQIHKPSKTESNIRHLVLEDRKICDRWNKDIKLLATQDPIGPKCYQCNRILKSAAGRSRGWKDPDGE